MIIKLFEISKLNLSNYSLFLFYGKNEGLQSDILKENFLKKFRGQVLRYEESEFINYIDNILIEIQTKSLFENEKIIIISRVTNKIADYVEKILEVDLNNVKIIFKSSILDKKSKLRRLFEEKKNLLVFPFYEDNFRDLSAFVETFLRKENIKLSRESINLIVSRARGDRKNARIELEKILSYSASNKNIDLEAIQKLTNLAENYGVNELADSYLAKNTKSVSTILNENHFSDEDCTLILRTILIKIKRLRLLIEKYDQLKNIDEVINSAKPPIFWKDKENIKIQVNKWNLLDLKKKIYEISEIEMLVKANNKNSLNLLSDFIVNY